MLPSAPKLRSAPQTVLLPCVPLISMRKKGQQFSIFLSQWENFELLWLLYWVLMKSLNFLYLGSGGWRTEALAVARHNRTILVQPT